MNKLEMVDIFKSFGGVHALKGVSLILEEGEVLGLVGENGAGKSTLIKILAGAINADSGCIKINGKECDIKAPSDALRNGISVIYQELNMASDLNVAENIFIGRYPQKGIIVDWKLMYRKSDELLKDLGAQIPIKAKVKDLSIAQQQIIEIAKAIKNQSDIIIFDEPSAVLGRKDSEVLFNLIAKLKSKGVSIVYISHRLDELLKITDRINILRDGNNVITKATEELTMEELVSYMTGLSYKEMWPDVMEPSPDAPIVFEVKNLHRGEKIKNVSFYIKRGEVLGLAGLVGSGRTEIARCLFGVDPIDSGEFYINGKKVGIGSPRQAMKKGIGFVMEDRKNFGLLLERPIFENITLTNLERYARAGWINSKAEIHEVQKMKNLLSIKTKNVYNKVNSLSGGNQQKVVLAKWLLVNPDIFILDEPTRGVDVVTKAEIYRIIENLKEEGKSILLISSEFTEIMGLSNRIVVIRRGESVAEFTRQEASQDVSILEAMAEERLMQNA